ncbi:hypothetical protein OBBRIDRAFT_378109 [Obba rivulosa]|uniref:Uncharacterized protein n=1 Tax=Obba rivulosa TaxID=1052685 RepID=A0A8E2B5F4_9APHY|nr:hypothetical protein OBBRIDRAFT_378109 [Obba rivulosa]
MIPRYANPSFLSDQLEIVSRAALNGEEDETPMDIDNVPSGDRAAMVAQLENILKRSLGDIELGAAGDVQPEDGHRKKKRRKTEESLQVAAAAPEEAELSESMSFRLVSNKLPPKPIALQAKPPPVIKAKEPSREDTAEEAELRASRAKAVAVDFDWILEQSTKVYVPPRQNDRKVIHVTAQLPDEAPAVMVAERPRSKPPKKPHLCLTDTSLEVTPSPHNLRPTCALPVVEVNASSKSDVAQTKRRRRRTKDAPPRPPPMFWRPPRGIGGKSAGYAMGYAGSWPMYEGDPRRYRYHRDTMKKAIFVR